MPYSCSLDASGFDDADRIVDVSDEEEPIPGKFMGGKNGKGRPTKKPKFSTKPQKITVDRRRSGLSRLNARGGASYSRIRQLPNGDDANESPEVDGVEANGHRAREGEDNMVCDTISADDLASALKGDEAVPLPVSASNNISNLFLALSPSAAPSQSPTKLPQEQQTQKTREVVHSVIKCCVSRFGLPPTIYFSHTQELTQNMPPCPERFATTSLTVVRKNSQTGLYFKIGPGAVAFRYAKRKRCRDRWQMMPSVLCPLVEPFIFCRVVLNVFSQSGLVHTNHPTRWNVLWTKRVTLQEWASANEYQKINHFPGTRGIARFDFNALGACRLSVGTRGIVGGGAAAPCCWSQGLPRCPGRWTASGASHSFHASCNREQ